MVATLTIGIAAGSFGSVWAAASDVVLEDLPYDEPDELRWIWRENWDVLARGWLSGEDIDRLRAWDDDATNRAAVIDDVLAGCWFPEGHAVGARTVVFGDTLTVVGVARGTPPEPSAHGGPRTGRSGPLRARPLRHRVRHGHPPEPRDWAADGHGGGARTRGTPGAGSGAASRRRQGGCGGPPVMVDRSLDILPPPRRGAAGSRHPVRRGRTPPRHRAPRRVVPGAPGQADPSLGRAPCRTGAPGGGTSIRPPSAPPEVRAAATARAASKFLRDSGLRA